MALITSACADEEVARNNFNPAARVVSDVRIDNGQRGDTVNVAVTSWRDIPFKTVTHQAYDYSCGSAAIATLLTYVYGMPTKEQDVFFEMFQKGDQNKIRREGFSLLDMAHYLNNHGLKAQGYRLPVGVIDTYKVPFIAMVNNKGYNHFVVVKTVGNNRVLVGDPNSGNTIYTLQDFGKIWNGISLIVTNEASKAHIAFANQDEWRYTRAHMALRDANDSVTELAALSPMSWQIAPIGNDVLPAATIGSGLSPVGAGGLQ